MLRKVLVSAVALSLAASTAALAQDVETETSAGPERTERPERGPHGMFSRLDRDGDGRIGADEFGGGRLEMMRAADADGDGALTEEEIATYLMNRHFQRRAERAARHLDINGDGTVTIAEIEDYQGKRFALLDRDNDGQISREEMRRSGMGKRFMHHRRMGEHGPRAAMRGWDRDRQDSMMHHHRGQPRFIDEVDPMAPEEASDGE
ncbi:EF-hand domain-containing protein [Nitratireductor sp. GCM10026969]|uniref:EF-hand domain-containing protein n=1 Tax=Nitratireductor sp. GCM10026969 TaxID=3252645 RepID=UPI00361DDCF3